MIEIWVKVLREWWHFHKGYAGHWQRMIDEEKAEKAIFGEALESTHTGKRGCPKKYIRVRLTVNE